MTDSEVYYDWPPQIKNKEDLMRYLDKHEICYTVKLSIEELEKIYPKHISPTNPEVIVGM